MMKLIATTILALGLLQSYAQTDSILFIGNSYTGTNNIPSIFTSMAGTSGKSVYVSSYTPGGNALSDHYNNATVTNLINSANWDYIVLQEQSQMIAWFPSTTQYYMGQFYNLIEANNGCTELVAYMTWARKEGNMFYTENFTYDDMVNEYENFYQDYVFPAVALGRISPVGTAFHTATAQGHDVYSSDGSHPNTTGSYLSACVFYATIFKETPVGNSYTILGNPVTTSEMQQIAEDVALGDSYNYWIDKISFTISDNSIIAGNSIDFGEYVWYDDNVPTYDWTFEGGSPTNGQGTAITVTYNTPGVYDATLSISNECGYTESRTMKDTITVNSVSSTNINLNTSATLSPNHGTNNTKFHISTTSDDYQNWELYSVTGVRIPLRISDDGLLHFKKQSGYYLLRNTSSGQRIQLLID